MLEVCDNVNVVVDMSNAVYIDVVVDVVVGSTSNVVVDPGNNRDVYVDFNVDVDGCDNVHDVVDAGNDAGVDIDINNAIYVDNAPGINVDTFFHIDTDYNPDFIVSVEVILL